MNQVATASELPVKGRGRWQLIGILMIVIGPMLLASAMYRWQFWVPEGRTYHGQLIGDGTQLEALGVKAAESGRWQILVTDDGNCASQCQKLVYLARQIQIGLNREADRAEHALAFSGELTSAYAEQLSQEYPQLKQLTLDAGRYQQAPTADGQAALWLVDPHGNVVLRYDSASNGKAILDDLRYLLKVSVIG